MRKTILSAVGGAVVFLAAAPAYAWPCAQVGDSKAYIQQVYSSPISAYDTESPSGEAWVGGRFESGAIDPWGYVQFDAWTYRGVTIFFDSTDHVSGCGS